MIIEMDVFLGAIRDWFNNPDRMIGDNVRLEAAASLADDTAVLLCRYGSSFPLYGHRYLLPEFAALTNSRDSAALAWEAIGEISEPPGPGQRLNVDWANGLTADPSAVRWVGEGGPVGTTKIGAAGHTAPRDGHTRFFGTYAPPRDHRNGL